MSIWKKNFGDNHFSKNKGKNFEMGIGAVGQSQISNSQNLKFLCPQPSAKHLFGVIFLILKSSNANLELLRQMH